MLTDITYTGYTPPPNTSNSAAAKTYVSKDEFSIELQYAHKKKLKQSTEKIIRRVKIDL